MAKESIYMSSVREIQNRVDIAEVADALGMAVVRRGASVRTLCPFHADKSPSLTLYQSGHRGPHFHCFACGENGDVFKLVQERLSCDFKESVEWLAAHLGVLPPKRLGKSRSTTTSEQSFPDWTYERSLAIYQRRNGIERVKEWLTSRKLPHSLASEADLAFSFAGTLTGELRDLQESGGDWRELQALFEQQRLIATRRSTEPSDSLFVDIDSQFRDFFADPRVLFPIKDLYGTVLGFAGRETGTSGSSSSPKYLFTPGLAKSTTLYRGDVVRNKLRNLKSSKNTDDFVDLFVCEGVVDALRLEAVSQSAVALLGAQASEAQINALVELEQLVPKSISLRINIFLDRDAAGMKGAAKLALALAKSGLDSTYVWPTTADLDGLKIPADDRKDPDGLLKRLNGAKAKKYLERWRHASGLAVITEHLGASVTPDDIIDQEAWGTISLGRRYKAAISLAKDPKVFEFLFGHQYSDGSRPKWIKDSREFSDQTSQSAAGAIREARQSIYLDDPLGRFQNARTLARSGAARGEVPTDEAAWRRLDVGGTSFVIGLQEQLSSKTFKPMEPFDAVMVSRGFDNDEPRLKAMPCPEDLILQQYLMAEVLTERFDAAEEKPFSSFIPAVRYYKDRGCTETTAEDLGFDRKDEVLSFAYQIDMDVLEGRRTSTNQGMFRPFMECWSQYIETLRRKSESYEEVHALRLDVRRYYDRLTRATVRDRLVAPFRRAIEQLIEKDKLDSFAPDFSAHGQNLPEALVDWFCDQSFDYEYYDPGTGESKQSNPGVGIPQGPVLSAWLATVALFPLDSAMRKEIKKIDEEDGLEDGPVAYARYVDDIFIIARSRTQLLRMRSLAEECARALGLELIEKGGDIPPMTSAEFREWLSAGKAFVGSGPRPEVDLIHLGDGETGSDTWRVNEVQRGSALELLSDQRLFTAGPELLADQLYTALQAADLRPSELPKLCRWIWYSVAEDSSEDSYSLWRSYWELWDDLTRNAKWTLDPRKRPWEDPMLYALEGLEKVLLLSPPVEGWEESTTGGLQSRLGRLAKAAQSLDFFHAGMQSQSRPPKDCGQGAMTLRRMFLSRAIVVNWIASHFSGQTASTEQHSENLLLSGISTTLIASLSRAWITHAETVGVHKYLRADLGDSQYSKSPLRKMFLWLHQAIVLLGHTRCEDLDPLHSIAGTAIGWSAYHAKQTGAEFDSTDLHSNSNFATVLALLAPTQLKQESLRDEFHRQALSTLLAICPVTNLTHCLALRKHLLIKELGARPLPSLPGIDLPYLLLVKTEHRAKKYSALSRLNSVIEVRPVPTDTTDEAELDFWRVVDSLPKKVDTKWQQIELETGNNVNLRVLEGHWDSPAERIFEDAPQAVSVFDAKHLNWVADVFEGLARINFEQVQRYSSDEGGGPMEYAPAWPFIVLSNAPEDSTEEDSLPNGVSTSSIGYFLPRNSLGRFAFMRDGQGRLKSFEVPLSDASVWRIGFAITDILGLAFELDKFGKPSTSTFSKNSNAAGYILREVLRRLRGEFASASGPLPRRKERPHLPASTYRALELLRRFPKDASEEMELAFVLSVEVESRAMEERLARSWDFEVAGSACSFLELVAASAMLRVSARWAGQLPQVSISDTTKFRRTVAAWLTFDARLDQLESNLLKSNQTSLQELPWNVLRSGVRLSAISTWLRSLALELVTNLSKFEVNDIQVPDAWGLDSTLLVVNEPNVELGEYFQKAISREGAISRLKDVTPLGWLTILSGLLQLYKNDGRYIPYDLDERNSLVEIFDRLSQTLAHTADSSIQDTFAWPLEKVGVVSGLRLNAMKFDRHIESLAKVDEILGFKVSVVKSEFWGMRARSDRFQDAQGRSRPLTKTLIDTLSPDKHIESEQRDSTFLFTWSETRTRDGSLIGVSVLGAKFAHVVAIDAIPDDLGILKALPARSRMPLTLEFEKGVEEPSRDASRGASSVDEEKPEVADVDSKEVAESNPAAGKPDKTSIHSSMGGDAINVLRKWNINRREAWTSMRPQRADCHLRIAIFQFRVDETYRHPIAEVGFPKEFLDYLKENIPSALKVPSSPAPSETETTRAETASIGREHKIEKSIWDQATSISKGTKKESEWTESAMLPSWAEHRRRQLLEAALESCEAFGVQVLVLPEYSVRPDTVAWLKKRMLELPSSNLAVYAGTYRIHGRTSHPHFEGLYEKVLGANQKNTVFKQNIELELGSVLTLLQPYEYKFSRDIAVLTRLKKYPSVAMEEVFFPGSESLSPLFRYDSLLEEMSNSGLLASKPKSAQDGLDVTKKVYVANYMSELVCSELFSVTSVANLPQLEREYAELRRRFGYPTDKQELPDDIKSLSQSWVHKIDGGTRRTILMVPAMTTRAADYWIYGQSAQLAAGLTTVFCSAVKPGLTGGSCFIGKDSSRPIKQQLGVVLAATPYSGWSRGIYLNKPEDPLGKEEQAIVIADIDPTYMNEGRPRPQALPKPMKLVAHLPIVETLKVSDLVNAYARKVGSTVLDQELELAKKEAFKGIFDSNSVALAINELIPLLDTPANKLVDPESTKVGSNDSYATLAKAIGPFTTDESAWEKRIAKWVADWRQMPQFGPPPSALDFIVVDQGHGLTQGMAEVFVPPWGTSKGSDHLKTKDDSDEDGV